MSVRPRLLVVLSAAAVSLPLATAGHASPSAPRVKPGLTYSTERGAGCSFAFLFTGSDGREYVTTAGHCAFDEKDRGTWKGDTGERVFDDRGQTVGRFAHGDLGDSTDFALIRLDRGLSGDPQMCAWGGPTSLLTDAPRQQVELHHNGGGIGYESTIPSRRAYANGIPRQSIVRALGVVSFGDSGSGTTTAAGAAVGINVHITVGVDNGLPTLFGMARLDLAIEKAERSLGIQLKLRTAPLLPEPLPTTRC